MRFNIGPFHISIVRLPTVPVVAKPLVDAIDAEIANRRRRHLPVKDLLNKRARAALMEVKMLDIRAPKHGWTEVFVDGAKLGGYGETTRPNDADRWYWSTDWTHGHCPTKDEAVTALRGLIGEFRAMRDRDSLVQAQYDALPDHLKPLRDEADFAEFEAQRIWGRNPFNQADYQSASTKAQAARLAFNKAHDLWLSHRHAA